MSFAEAEMELGVDPLLDASPAGQSSGCHLSGEGVPAPAGLEGSGSVCNMSHEITVYPCLLLSHRA